MHIDIIMHWLSTDVCSLDHQIAICGYNWCINMIKYNYGSNICSYIYVTYNLADLFTSMYAYIITSCRMIHIKAINLKYDHIPICFCSVAS